jgi:predicted nucleic acid-binding protein
LKSALDTNVIISLIGDEPAGALAAEEILEDARLTGALVICGAVYSELFAHPRLTPAILTQFLKDAGIEPEFDTGRQIWHEAGLRYSRYSTRRRKAKAGSPRRLLADFVIGAHALLQADRLVTFDGADFRRDFPELQIAPGRQISIK